MSKAINAYVGRWESVKLNVREMSNARELEVVEMEEGSFGEMGGGTECTSGVGRGTWCVKGREEGIKSWIGRTWELEVVEVEKWLEEGSIGGWS
ncbi:hypothetical protein M8J76_012011 [Diaphorina citri]|nr:hypothetical protein M8J76_012011 [Diaphorina citri]